MIVISLNYDPKKQYEKTLISVLDAFFSVTMPEALRQERASGDKKHSQINFVLEGCKASPDAGEGSNEP